jgi:hypothetical protein
MEKSKQQMLTSLRQVAENLEQWMDEKITHVSKARWLTLIKYKKVFLKLLVCP